MLGKNGHADRSSDYGQEHTNRGTNTFRKLVDRFDAWSGCRLVDSLVLLSEFRGQDRRPSSGDKSIVLYYCTITRLHLYTVWFYHYK